MKDKLEKLRKEYEDRIRRAEYDAAEAQRDNQKLRARLRELTEELQRCLSGNDR